MTIGMLLELKSVFMLMKFPKNVFKLHYFSVDVMNF